MAITRLAQMGFESNGTDSLSEMSGSTGSPTISDVYPKTGTYSLRLAPSAINSWAYYTLPLATRQIQVGFHLRSAGGMSADNTLFAARAAAADLFTINADNAGNITLWVGGSQKDIKAGLFPMADYAHFGIDFKIHSSAGWVTVYKDGVSYLTFAGNTGNADIATLRFGNQLTSLLNNWNYYDDVIICDSTGEAAAAVVSDVRFSWLQAETGAAQHNAWTGSDGNSVDNYALVDDRPHTTDTDYIEATATDLLNTVQLATMSIPVGMSIKALIPTAYAKKTDGGVDTHIAMVMYGAATLVTGADQELATSYIPMQERFVAKPGGGAWDQAALDALQVGVKSRGSY